MIRDLIKRYDRIRKKITDIDSTIDEVVEKNKDVLLSLNRDQMLLGRDAKGNELSPSYLNDPYFDNAAQAQAYAAMKQRLEAKHNARIENPTIYPAKNRTTPNLIVTGPFQDNMFIITSPGKFTIGSTYVDSGDIERKYNNEVFGIAPGSVMFFYDNYLKPALMRLIYNKR